LTSSQAFAFSACVALACHDLFSRYAGATATRIKWPNDIYWNDRKAGGILIENSFRGTDWVLAIAGMGININQTGFPESARHPISLRKITGQSFDVVGLARELGECLDRRYTELTAAAGAGPLIDAYNDRLYRRNETVRLKKENAVFETVVTGVSAQGQLLTKDVMERQFTFGEVEWVI
jgi:BirA family biotin operon repressor/biotin-[acetyl-CoA-carboxylase] ligase